MNGRNYTHYAIHNPTFLSSGASEASYSGIAERSEAYTATYTYMTNECLYPMLSKGDIWYILLSESIWDIIAVLLYGYDP